jgi:hypothetical protein
VSGDEREMRRLGNNEAGEKLTADGADFTDYPDFSGDVHFQKSG